MIRRPRTIYFHYKDGKLNNLQIDFESMQCSDMGGITVRASEKLGGTRLSGSW